MGIVVKSALVGYWEGGRTSFTLMGVNVSELSGACEMQARAASRCRVGCAEPELVECDLFIRM